MNFQQTLLLPDAVHLQDDLVVMMKKYIEDITWQREDMNFIFEW